MRSEGDKQVSIEMKYFKMLALLSIFILIGICVSAQQLNYSMGFTGNLSINNISVPSNSFPLISVKGDKCISIDNGLSKFMPSTVRLFVTNCIVDQPKGQLNLSIYPNPSFGGFITLTATASANPTGLFSIKIMELNGRVRIISSATMAELKSGVRINVSGLNQNMYIVHASSAKDDLSDVKQIIILK
ncbi:T9SS type A sorting domain-containing protein [Sediminibacterium goheungense]|uniref:Putative secreted protein (Por secretion system target) n=1 Tax=Sediminibacterium goheungense TaxID=1086393 RepID=A0A4R6IXA1_9BACT|nr:T9SS type A sorting domain-containing protein [Sediminibacterium goheungense]TDO27021.1 putative secreted protein (Por secretion system target) [Sediminibacterium goheungense]